MQPAKKAGKWFKLTPIILQRVATGKRMLKTVQQAVVRFYISEICCYHRTFANLFSALFAILNKLKIYENVIITSGKADHWFAVEVSDTTMSNF